MQAFEKTRWLVQSQQNSPAVFKPEVRAAVEPSLAEQIVDLPAYRSVRRYIRSRHIGEMGVQNGDFNRRVTHIEDPPRNISARSVE